MVVADSERSARALRLAYNQRRRAEGLSAWPAPGILDFASFVRAEWEGRCLDGRLVLNSAQEQALWADIAGREKQLGTLLEGPRQRLAAMAMQAHELLCSFAPRSLRQAARSGWDQDAAAFSDWLAAFDTLCRDDHLLSTSRVPLELISLLQQDPAPRPPLLAAGFDRVLPTQQALFDAWGVWQRPESGDPARSIHFYRAVDTATELNACAIFCQRQLATHPDSRLLVIAQDIAARRGEMERAFLRIGPPGASPLFEFSLGIPLSQVPVARAAHLLLRWLDAPLEESELDWLLSTGFAAAGREDTASLRAFMRALRHRNLQRTRWTLETFTRQSRVSAQPPSAWVQRMSKARQRVRDLKNRPQAPLDWAALVPRLLQDAGLPGEHRLSSAEFQAYRRWEQALDTCGSLGFDGRRVPWEDFLSALSRTLSETLFSPESSDAPILIMGPAESAGLTADAIWFLGADEDSWPCAGSTHPLLPPQVQREAGMPHATPRNDLELAQAVTARLLTAAPVVCFSFAGQKAEVEARPSRLIAQLAGPPQPMPAAFALTPVPPPLTVPFQDFSRIPFPDRAIEGGSSVLTVQSQCPFKAFATFRLGAKTWEPAEAGLTASQRGQLLHAVLHAVWAGPPHGIRTLDELRARSDLTSFVETHVQKVLREEMPAGVRESMPPRYLELEQTRLTRLVTEWLRFESTRLPFTVVETEAPGTANVAGLTLSLRLDRIDRLNDDSLLVIDYKSGNVSPNSWQLPRPDDVQLPLYAGFALDDGEVLGGLVFAKVRTGERSFAGHVGDASATLIAGLKGTNALIKAPFTAEQLIDWKECIEQLARDFLAGRAEVDPRDPPSTCERCGLQTLCRIQENQPLLESEEEEAADE